MSKLRASITFKHKVDEAKIIQQRKMRENVAEPIVPIVINDDSNSEIQNESPINLETQKGNLTNIQEDNSDVEDDESQIISNWNTLINIWEQLLLQEEDDAEINLDDDFDTEFDEILLNKTHPALDNEAK